MHKLIEDEPYELSDVAAAFVKELNAQWDQAQSRRERHEAEAKRIAAIDPLEFTAKDAAAKRKHREDGIAILQATIPLQKRLTQWPEMRAKERRAELDRAAQRQEDAAAQVTEQLRSIGFDPLAFALAAASDETEHRQFQREAESAIETVALYHPSAAPHSKHGRHISRLVYHNYDVKRDDIDKQIENAQAALRSLIAATS